MIDPDKPMRVRPEELENRIRAQPLQNLGVGSMALAISYVAHRLDTALGAEDWRTVEYSRVFHRLMNHEAVGSDSPAAQDIENALNAIADALRVENVS